MAFSLRRTGLRAFRSRPCGRATPAAATTTTTTTTRTRWIGTTTIGKKKQNDDDIRDDRRTKLDRRISIDDVIIQNGAPVGSNRPDLIPRLPVFSSSPVVSQLSSSPDPNLYLTPCQQSHLRWMLQKDLKLHQDFVLLGPPALARDRRHLLMMYCALVEREVEYIAISRDTSDADLKQRKEVFNHDTIYVDQAPVRAARHGRLLILDGLEKAERNVLPSLNNLLENREMALDDGSLLVAPQIYDQYVRPETDETRTSALNNTTVTSEMIFRINRVHPDFRVAALASFPAKLDPPLRSRFQARVTTYIDPGEMLQSLTALSCTGTNSEQQQQQQQQQQCQNGLSIETLQELVQLAASVPDGLSFYSVCDAMAYLQQTPNRLLSPQVALLPHGVGMISVNDLAAEENSDSDIETKETSLSSSPFVETITTKKLQGLMMNAFDAGHRGVCLVGPKGSYKSSLAKNFSRTTQQPTALFSLYSDMTSRDLLLTRGTDGNGNTIWRSTPLTRAIVTGHGVILDGIDKLSADTLTSVALLLEQGQIDLPDGRRLYAKESFRCIALAHPPPSDSDNFMTPEVKGMFHWIQVDPLPTHEIKEVLMSLYPSLDPTALDKIVDLRDRLDDALATGAADNLEEQETLVLSLRKMKHICKRVEQHGSSDLSRLVHNALLTSLMPERERKIVEKSMDEAGIKGTDRRSKKNHKFNQLDQSTLEKCRRAPKNPLLVPNPVFEENPGHGQVLADILDAHDVGERALLVMGYQGVGKNRVVDYLLNQLQCEREYVQLHRDTTVQSLLTCPSVEGNRIVYADSPLVRAAKNGRILVIDEADKAPVEVVALLKGLIEDGELALPDGRVLRYDSAATKEESNENNVSIHSGFQMWALANPAGYPFHGNNLAREMADVFSCHSVPPLDAESQRRILKRYGPDVLDDTLTTLINVWQDLRDSHEKSSMTHPYSVREAVSVVKHLNQFPSDGLEAALENVISFDRFDNATLKQLSAIFSRHGVQVPYKVSPSGGTAFQKGIKDGVSTPRTRASRPKHGNVDENNEPHVGGNTWAGGSGGSDTAGLGGRGGPYRLDSGHPVHQVSDAMKAQVSEEAQKRAREIAKEALAKKLEDLNMGELDWKRYESLHEQVGIQIQQLQVMLKDIKRRKEERVWLKRQSTGELDDSRLVDALAGEKDIFKRRGKLADANSHAIQASGPISIKLVVDISASMYRFNGLDGRLQRLLEATLMIMEALRDDDRFRLSIVGHSGDSPEIPLVNEQTPKDPKDQLRVLETMVAHTQYCYAGDKTLEAIERAVNQAAEGDLVVVISDANLQRYSIEPDEVSTLLRRKDVHAHLVLISSFGEEAHRLARSIPNERAQVCLESSDLPLIVKRIVTSAAKYPGL